MNERIRELATQAGYKDFDYAIIAHKFADLLIQECIESGNDLAKHYINNHSEQEQAFLLAAIADYSNEIKKRFGVE